MESQYAGVIGAGSFGTAIANIIAENSNVMLLVRDERQAQEISVSRHAAGQELAAHIIVTADKSLFTKSCEVIFPIIPAVNFRDAMYDLQPFLGEDHILVHGTKGLDPWPYDNGAAETGEIQSMSKTIWDVTPVRKIGCLAGPNLAREIAEGKPAATVVATEDETVFDLVQKLLRSDRFQVLYSSDVFGVELCGILKNIMAIAAGACSGLELGENAKSLLVNRCMVEMIHIGEMLGAKTRTFLGVAGLGDLMATCNSPQSRNFTVGYRLAKGESLAQIVDTMEETAEGINTTLIVGRMAEQLKWKSPITRMVYKVLAENYPVEKAITFLMKLPVKVDIDFM